ncbi:MAG: hypothetical protein M1485_01020 [Chloroflexi bacterium]|nr:hypothetical protein [Chloroflexota bacterium]
MKKRYDAVKQNCRINSLPCQWVGNDRKVEEGCESKNTQLEPKLLELVEPANKAIKEHLTYKAPVEHFDETGCVSPISELETWIVQRP